MFEMLVSTRKWKVGHTAPQQHHLGWEAVVAIRRLSRRKKLFPRNCELYIHAQLLLGLLGPQLCAAIDQLVLLKVDVPGNPKHVDNI